MQFHQMKILVTRGQNKKLQTGSEEQIRNLKNKDILK